MSATPTANAATEFTNSYEMGSACQLSIPTTNTGVRPKATGFRNESKTISNFVICPVQLPNVSTGGNTFLMIGLYSLDGQVRNISCTAVSDWFGNPQIYSTQSINVSTTIGYEVLGWDGPNFGTAAGFPFRGLSVTCNLPPQTAINFIRSDYTFEVGN